MGSASIRQWLEKPPSKLCLPSATLTANFIRDLTQDAWNHEAPLDMGFAPLSRFAIWTPLGPRGAQAYGGRACDNRSTKPQS